MSKYAPKPAGGCWGGGGVKTGAVEVNLQLFDVKGLNLFKHFRSSPFNCKGKYYPLLLAM